MMGDLVKKSPWLYLKQCVVVIQYIEGILPKVIDILKDTWHNSEGSIVHKSRRKGVNFSLQRLTVLLEYFDFSSDL